MVSKQVLLFSIVFKVAAMFIGVCGNIAVIILTRTSKFWSTEKTETSYFVGNLALADLLVCVTLYPTWIVEFALTLLDIESDQLLFCKFSRSFAYSLLFASVASLLAITVDRYIYILKPLKYPYIVTRKRVFTIIFSIWLSASCVFTMTYTFMKTSDLGWRGLCLLSVREGYHLRNVSLYVLTLLIIIMNLLIFMVSRKQRRKILSTMLTPNGNTTADHGRYRMRTVLRFFVGLRQAKTFFIVVVMLIFCIIVPTVLNSILYRFNSSVRNYWYLNFSYEFYGINSVVNAFIYGMRHVKYRKAFAKILFKFFSCVKKSR